MVRRLIPDVQKQIKTFKRTCPPTYGAICWQPRFALSSNVARNEDSYSQHRRHVLPSEHNQSLHATTTCDVNRETTTNG